MNNPNSIIELGHCEPEQYKENIPRGLEYDSYSVCNCEDKEVTRKLFRILFKYSDSFSLLYYKTRKDEELRSGVMEIRNALEKYKMGTKKVLEWPGTMQYPDHEPICELVTYEANEEIIPMIENVGCLWDWDYPDRPSDIAFYKRGYAWFESSAHENLNFLYLGEGDDYPNVSDFEAMGIELEPDKKAHVWDLFLNMQAIPGLLRYKEAEEMVFSMSAEDLRKLAQKINDLASDDVPNGETVTALEQIRDERNLVKIVLEKAGNDN